MALAVIGGTGVYDPSWLQVLGQEEVETPYGRVMVLRGSLVTGESGGRPGTSGGREVYFLARHGRRHAVPPHRVNYRANIAALRELGVARVVATAAVGSLRPEIEPGLMLLPDQFLDFTRGRPSSFYEGDGTGVAHVDMSEPYCPELRRALVAQAARLGFPCREGGVYVCTEGPRFETPAEIRAFALLGGDVVGMTGVPEVCLAREAGLCYATVATVTNHAAGIATHRLTHSEVLAVMEANAERLRRLLAAVLAELPEERGCACGEPLEVFGL